MERKSRAVSSIARIDLHCALHFVPELEAMGAILIEIWGGIAVVTANFGMRSFPENVKILANLTSNAAIFGRVFSDFVPHCASKLAAFQ